MPQLNTSETVRQRLRCLLQRLIAFANNDLFDCEPLETKINVRWIAEGTSAPKLIVKTEIRFLAELVFQKSDSKTKEKLKQDLRALKDFLGRLEDNRDRTQGSGIWHFTLLLWDQSIDKNMTAFDEAWQKRKGNLKKVVPKEVLPKDTLPLENRPLNVNPQSVNPFSTNPLGSTSLLKHDVQPIGSTLNFGQEKLSLGDAMATSLHSPSAISSSLQGIDPPKDGVSLFHNLPTRDYGTFVGRARPLQQLMTFLRPEHPAARVSVTGIGGIGKTALVLEIAHRCRITATQHAAEQGCAVPFDALIFASTKTQHFTPHGILPSYRYSRTLQDLFRTIAQTLKCPDVLMGDFDHQRETIYELLAHQRTLLILDNLDAVPADHQQEMLSFLYELPAAVKVIATSRLQLPMDKVIPLAEMSPPESMQFIHHQSQLKAVALSLLERQQLSECTCGMPAAMVYAIGQLAVGYQLPQVLPKLTLKTGDYCRYYWEGMVSALRGKSAYDLLRALSLFPASASRQALISIAQLSETVAVESFVALERRSLVMAQEGRYSMLPLTRDYILADVRSSEVRGADIDCCADELNDKADGHADGHIGETVLRERWLSGCKDWLVPHCHDNWRVWHDYSSLDVEWDTLQAVVEWCIATDRYQDFGELWSGLRGYTHLRGCWNERLSWLEWWLQAAQHRGDSVVVTQALRDLGWTLTLMGKPHQLESARDYFSQAWALRPQNDMASQLDLAIEHVVLYLVQGQLQLVEPWLATAKTLLAQAALGSPEVTVARHQTRLNYYTAQLHYWQGNYALSKSLYQDILVKVRAQPKTLKQQQTEVYCLNWLVDIALKEDNLKEADRMLQQSWPIIHGRRDMRSQAFHQRSKAQLEKLRGNFSDFQHWSQQAKACFETLSMETQVQEMQAWLIENDTHFP
ncbi:MAG: AAA family ATPase [Cyanobacteria bacterium P01_F01_bin.53]